MPATAYGTQRRSRDPAVAGPPLRTYDARMSKHARNHENPDDEETAYENDADDIRRAREREAGLTALGGPTFGASPYPGGHDDGGFDAQHNP